MDKKDKVDVTPIRRDGVKITHDSSGNAFVSMPVNNMPLKQFENWIKECIKDYSGKRWDMIIADHNKAKAYDALLMTMPQEEDMPEDKETNPLGLMNGGKENGK